MLLISWLQKHINEDTNYEMKTIYLDSRSYFSYIISNILLSGSFKGYLCAYNAHKNTNFILSLVDLVTTPTERIYITLLYRLFKLASSILITKVLIYQTIHSPNPKRSHKRNIRNCYTTYLILLRAVLVTTSAPCSKRSGIRFANRKIFKPYNRNQKAS